MTEGKRLIGKASFVWSGGEGPNRYLDLWQTFVLPQENDRPVRLCISADSRYAVWVNGTYVPAWQYADYPGYKVFDEIDISPLVRSGENRLAVLGYFQGEDSSVYRLGRAGVCFAVAAGDTPVALSGERTLCRETRTYRSGEVERITGQLSFSFRYDATQDDGWRNDGYRPGADWHPAQPTGYAPQLFPRPIRQMELMPARPAVPVAQGLLFGDDPALPAGDRMMAAALAFRSPAALCGAGELPVLPAEGGIPLSADAACDGVWIVLDLSAEESGLFTLDVDLPQAAEILIGYGEHLDDLRVRTAIDGRQFAAVYRARAGRQTFMHAFKRFGGRYIQLHILAPRCTLYYAGLRPTPYPVTERPAFLCDDTLHTRLYAVGCRTLRLCMHEHYEDTPWREQALYAMDGRNQMLFGYYAFGETAFAAASLRLLALGLRPDGLLELCAPARVPVTIPAFSLCFIIALREYARYANDTALVRELWGTVERVLSTFAEKAAEIGGVLPPRFCGEQMWNFFEWQPGLDGAVCGGRPGEETVIDAPLCAFYAMALRDAADLAQSTGRPEISAQYRQRYAQVRDAVQCFWDPAAGVYATTRQNGENTHHAELTQALFICAGLAGEHEDTLCRRLAAPEGLIPVTLSCTVWKYDALMTRPQLYARTVAQDIARTFGAMLARGATSFWETARGQLDFSRAGSLCHGWSAVPVYFYRRYVLGEQPQPGEGCRIAATGAPIDCGIPGARCAE